MNLTDPLLSKCIHEREIGSKIPIDRVNMYASFYKAVKL